MFADRFFPAVYFGNRYFAPGVGEAAPLPEASRGGDPVPGDRKRRRIKRETYEKPGRTLREIFSEPARVMLEPAAPEIAPTEPPKDVPRETIAQDFTPLVNALESLRVAAAAMERERAIEADDAEVLVLVA